MKPAALLLSLLVFGSPAHADPELVNPLSKYTAILFTHGDEYEIGPIPEGLMAPEGLSIHVESVKDGVATCILINNTGKPVYYTGEQESPIYHLEKRDENGKWVKVDMWLECGDGLTQATLPARHCRRFRIETRDPVVKAKLDCYTKIPEKEEDLAFKVTAWSKEIQSGARKSESGTPAK
ncbi:MAG: hypothetical protein EOP88_00105 [Verrucomicrobiaceae bacterium]|nr:MAG: hypothetical protein EOP88_00105 [Verrucomicrobiaceae bacterium]